MGAGIIVSVTQPEALNRYTWLKPLTDGSIEFYEPDDGGWSKTVTIPAPASASHTHSDVKLEVKTDAGVLVFENGILVKVG
jgi:hypothetical protein